MFFVFFLTSKGVTSADIVLLNFARKKRQKKGKYRPEAKTCLVSLHEKLVPEV
jgi:hypothetical protein